MKFLQLSSIEQLEPGRWIEATQTLRGDEEYLRDHFPRFPVMPGVLMLEGLFQAASFLVRATRQHQPGLVLLQAAKNVKFGDFVAPGQTLKIRVDVVKEDGDSFIVKGQGTKDGSVAVAGRLVLACEPTDPDCEVAVALARREVRQIMERLQNAAME
ncbi:MAG: beta-hydroxyacyl-ACP dehydratase [Planctomycetota bacterium]|nr:MAG: beta-hydroxyacyl-ACP dehydratase [Planctomycetota bacterium]